MVIEIGLAYGVSALAIAEALVSVGSSGPYLIIDAFQQEQFHDAGWRAIERAGLVHLASLLRERSQHALPRLWVGRRRRRRRRLRRRKSHLPQRLRRSLFISGRSFGRAG